MNARTSFIKDARNIFALFKMAEGVTILNNRNTLFFQPRRSINSKPKNICEWEEKV